MKNLFGPENHLTSKFMCCKSRVSGRGGLRLIYLYLRTSFWYYIDNLEPVRGDLDQLTNLHFVSTSVLNVLILDRLALIPFKPMWNHLQFL